MNNKIFLLGLVMILLTSFVSAATDFTANNQWWISAMSGSITDDSSQIAITNNGVSTSGNNMIFNSVENDYIVLGNNLRESDNVGTVVTRFTPDSVTGSNNLFYIGSETSTSPVIGVRISDGKLLYVFRTDSSTSLTICIGSSTLSTGNEYQLAISSTGSAFEFNINGATESFSCTTGSNNGRWFNDLGSTYTHKYMMGAADNGGSISGYIDGDMQYLAYYSTKLTTAQLLELYNKGSNYNPYIEEEIFELTASNLYNGSTIDSFIGNITNSSGTTSVSTTNGTIFFKYNEEELYDIEISANNYFTYSISDYNLSTDLNASLYQAELRVTANDSVFKTNIGNFSITINDSSIFSSNSSVGEAFFKLNADTYRYNAEHENYTGNVTGYFIVPALSLTNETIDFSRDIQNVLGFKDQRTGEDIENGNITIVYPNGYEINLTTNSTGQINFSVYGNESHGQSGEYSVTFLAYEGYISPVTFNKDIDVYNYPLIENISISDTSIIVNVFDRETLTLLNKEANISIIGYASASTNNGTYNFNNITVSAGDLVIKVVSDGYITEQSTVIYTGQENATINIYMLNSTATNAGFLFVNVIDEFYRTQPDSVVELYEYDESSLAYIKVSEVRTNINGEAVFGVELNTKTYYLKAFKTIGGQLYSVETTPEIIKTDNEVRNLVMRLTQITSVQPTDYLTIDISETFTNNISTIFIDFSTIDNFATQVCVQYFLIKTTEETSVYLQCVSSSSAYTATPILINRSNKYRADVYQLQNGVKYNLESYYYDSVSDFGELFDSDDLLNYVIFFVWIIIIVFMFKSEKIMILLVLGLILSWAELTLAPTLMNVAGSILKTVIIIFMYITSRKKEDLG